MPSTGEHCAKRCHRLKSLSVVGGFLDGMHIEFADGLNCLIGHRGTGKTTVLEFIRYALDEFPKGNGTLARKRVEALVKSNLGDGRIRLALETKDGLEYIVDRSASGEPMVLTADEQPTDIRIHSAGIFTADIFSQNEVENIADSPKSQLALIDKFAADRISEINRQVKAARNRLEANANAIVAVRQQLEGLADEVGTLSVVKSRIEALAEEGGDAKTDEVNVAQEHRALRGREEQAVREAQDVIQKYREWVHSAVGRFGRQTAAAFDEATLTGPNGESIAGKRVHLGSRVLASKLDPEPAQNTVIRAISSLRDRIGKITRDRLGRECGRNDVIGNDEQGYHLRSWIVVEVYDEAGTLTSTGGTALASQLRTARPATRKNQDGESDRPLSDRQRWVLAQLSAGAKLTRRELEREFGISARTAKRDLAELTDAGMIAFDRSENPGCYRLG